MNRAKKAPLYRKVNTCARGVHHNSGGKYRWRRSSQKDHRIGMARGVRRGLDYTPLFRFLLARVGADWNAVHSEAVARLDRPEPIFWLVALCPEDRRPVVGIGESTYFSGLYVDEDNRLQVVDPSIGPGTLEPACACCTHTFNGIPFTKRYQAGGAMRSWRLRGIV
jgi:hypothetical protein